MCGGVFPEAYFLSRSRTWVLLTQVSFLFYFFPTVKGRRFGELGNTHTAHAQRKRPPAEQGVRTRKANSPASLLLI